MNLTFAEFEERLGEVREKIGQACARAGRDPSEVQLMAVTKTHPAAAVEYAARAGLFAVGENRVQEAVEKRPEVRARIRWELIGSLQSNKAKAAVQTFDRIQSVDRPKLVRVLQKHCQERERGVLPILLEVNAGDDPAKHGVACEDAPALLEKALEADLLKVEGLMTIAPLSDDPDVAKRCFARLRELRSRLEERFGVDLPELSMGMTQDLEQAVEAGSTCIRIGTALYGARETYRA